MCFFCNCKTMIQSVTTHVVTLERCVIVIRNVPCEECAQCGERYFSDEVMEQLDKIVMKAKELAGEVLILDYHNRVA